MNPNGEGESAFKFFVPGIPHGQGRPRFTRIGKFSRAYKDKNDVESEGQIAFWFRKAAGADWQLLECPVMLEIDALFLPPKRLEKRARTLCQWFPHVSRPDASNIVKGVEDALNGVAWRDDAQVFYVRCTKGYCTGDETPGLKIEIIQCPRLAVQKQARAGKHGAASFSRSAPPPKPS